MADVEWQPLPALWPEPAVWTDVGEFMLLVFTQDGVPTWEVNRRAKAGSSHGLTSPLPPAPSITVAQHAGRCQMSAQDRNVTRCAK
jgi:hypothetical protein